MTTLNMRVLLAPINAREYSALFFVKKRIVYTAWRVATARCQAALFAPNYALLRRAQSWMTSSTVFNDISPSFNLSSLCFCLS